MKIQMGTLVKRKRENLGDRFWVSHCERREEDPKGVYKVRRCTDNAIALAGFGDTTFAEECFEVANPLENFSLEDYK